MMDDRYHALSRKMYNELKATIARLQAEAEVEDPDDSDVRAAIANGLELNLHEFVIANTKRARPNDPEAVQTALDVLVLHARNTAQYVKLGHDKISDLWFPS